MDRVAVFIDAGYLFASGSQVLCNEKLTRGQLKLDIPAVVDFFKQFAEERSNLPLLRIYWYDGTASGPTIDQQTLGATNDVKVRLGFVNSQGQQKGVDSLLVTDLINLARNRAMSTAVLLTGDEDIRVGVQQAQEFGVRVHLVGIQQEKQSQSYLLVQEADQCHQIGHDDIATFLAIGKDPAALVAAMSSDETTPLVERVAKVVWDNLSKVERDTLVEHLDDPRSPIPRDTDRQLLTLYSKEIGRELSFEERKEMREAFKRIAGSPKTD